jgi:UDP-glucose 4-epimerase
MRIAVTGGGGFLGTHLLKRLRAKFPDATLAAVVLEPPRVEVDGVRYINDLERADLVFHLAGGGSVESSLRDPVADLQLNTRTTVEILERARAVGTGRLVFASSAAVYGRVDGIVTEDRPPTPVSPYGVSKLASELYVRAYGDLHRLDACIARIGNAYGSGQRQLAIYDLARRALSEPPPLQLHGTGEEVRDFVHVSDVCEALCLIALSGERGGTYNVASGRQVALREVARLVAQAAGHGSDAVSVDGAGEAGKTSVFCPSIHRITSLGFQAGVSLEHGILETVAWLRSEQ